MNGVVGKRTADGSAEKRAKMGGHWAQGGGKEVDGWRQGVERTVDGSAEKGAKMRVVATQWAPEGNEWRIQTHQAYGASQADTGRPDADAIRRTHIFLLLIYVGGFSILTLVSCRGCPTRSKIVRNYSSLNPAIEIGFPCPVRLLIVFLLGI